MKSYFALIFVLGSYMVTAQDVDSVVKNDSVSIRQRRKVQFYVAPTYSVNQFSGTSASFAGASLGIVYRDQLEISVAYSVILNKYKKEIIFPSIHKYGQKNAGILVQYSFLHKAVRPLVGLGMQFTEASWKPENESGDIFTDFIYNYQIHVGTTWGVNKIVSLQATCGYTIAQGVELVGLESSDYDGFMATMLLKIRISR